MRALPILLACSAPLLFGACSIATAHIAVLRANQHFERGNYQPAMVAYLSLLSAGRYEAVLAYNLGNIYHSIGEADAAQRMWDSARAVAPQKLLFNIAFNKGIQFYEQGDYRQAFEQFRYALELNDSNLDAKRNLELSLRRLRAGETVAADRRSAATIEIDGAADTEALRLLEYIRRKEGQLWSAQHPVAGGSTDIRNW